MQKSKGPVISNNFSTSEINKNSEQQSELSIIITTPRQDNRQPPKQKEPYSSWIAVSFVLAFTSLYLVGLFKLTGNNLNEYLKNLGQFFTPFFSIIAAYFFRNSR
ncbi:MAG TPA: hypothetical protein VKU00_31490 [Chthonomonadaceae bacterium]|nr:hypothetical protein [Chthonomonadaceae bacterium]